MNWKHVYDEARFAAEKMTKTAIFESGRMFCDVYGLEAGQSQKVHVHTDADKVYFVLEGEGVFRVGTEERTLGRGAAIWAKSGEEHGVTNPGPARLALLVFMAPHPNFRKI